MGKFLYWIFIGALLVTIVIIGNVIYDLFVSPFVARQYLEAQNRINDEIEQAAKHVAA